MHRFPRSRRFREVRHRFHRRQLRTRYPVFGQDIKIMGLRDGDTITLTIACAMVDRYCAGLAQYRIQEILKEQIEKVARKYTRRKSKCM